MAHCLDIYFGSDYDTNSAHSNVSVGKASLIVNEVNMTKDQGDKYWSKYSWDLYVYARFCDKLHKPSPIFQLKSPEVWISLQLSKQADPGLVRSDMIASKLWFLA